MDNRAKNLSLRRQDQLHKSRDTSILWTQCPNQTKRINIAKYILVNWQISSLFCKTLLSTIATSQTLNQLAQNKVLALRFRT